LVSTFRAIAFRRGAAANASKVFALPTGAEWSWFDDEVQLLVILPVLAAFGFACSRTSESGEGEFNLRL